MKTETKLSVCAAVAVTGLLVLTLVELPGADWAGGAVVGLGAVGILLVGLGEARRQR